MKLRCKILHRYNVAAAASEQPLPKALESSSWSWPSSPAAFRMGDLIGTESGYCMMSDVAEQVEAESEGQGFCGAWRERRERERGRKREIPPPITLLCETARMPWNFTRECSDDGRLIVRAERVKRREYVEENREISGRVIMKLVSQDDDDDVYCEECGWLMDEEEEEEEEEEEGVEFDEGLEGFDEDEEESAIEKEEEEGERLELESESERCGDLREDVSYSAGGGLVRDSESLFWKGVGVGDGASGCLGRPASVPIMPMTPVM